MSDNHRKIIERQYPHKRMLKGSLSLIQEEGLCQFCGHDKAWSKNYGTFCTSCGKDINIEENKLIKLRIRK